MIEYRNVSKTYADGTVAVGDFSLQVPAKSTTVLVGSSGCGKTTLLRMVNRMVDPTQGDVLINGESVQQRQPVQLRREIGYVMQQAGLLPHRTVVDNIAAPLVVAGERRRSARERARAMLPRVGLSPQVVDKYPAQLSGGQQQRVGVARALVKNPSVLLMDEPFGAVDPIVRGELQAELLRLRQELAATIIFVTHDISEAFLLGDQVVILQAGGKVAQAGTPTQIQAAPANDFVRSFIGAAEVLPQLSLQRQGRTTVVVDGNGQALGVLPQ